MDAEEEEHQTRMRMGAAYIHTQLERANSISYHGGSTMNHRVIDRNREKGHARLYRDYFSDTPTYKDTQFRRRFRMRRSLFMRIEEAVTAHDNYFTQRTDAVGIRGMSSLQKVTAALRILAYGTAADAIDDYVRIGESTAIESLRRFVKSIVEVFGTEYLRRPNAEDVSRLLAENEQRGFPGMLGSIDWSLNDINVLDRSHLFEELAEGRGPEVRYTINGHEYNMGYYLADGIYPSWPTLVKTIPKPQGNKRKYFAIAQVSVRKDVERAFGVLQSRFAMIRGPSRFWDVGTMKYIMTACIILRNMIIEDERDLHAEEEHFAGFGIEIVGVAGKTHLQIHTNHY
ncbi:uncharacterized protein LOC108217333 [Daucus carota subsp. sativus]|uniref:uncharacterized protein LOC108217333 n=1 Tax=Daucus carota subsp. sativus TaxID=79200 RepID=UPI0007EF94DA|nr:PREDICTED: uncharacterized protein LOC108217333 [Daucus carota subsp. sativus]